MVGEIFSVPVHIGPEADPASYLYKGSTGSLFVRVKGLGRSIDYLSTFSTDVRNRWNCTSVSLLYLQWRVTEGCLHCRSAEENIRTGGSRKLDKTV